MKKITYLGIVLLSMTLLVLSCSKEDGPDVQDQQTSPKIDVVSPTSGPVGTTIILEGTGFGDTKEDNEVRFNGRAAIIRTASTTRLVIEIPEGATTGLISVKVGAKSTISTDEFVIYTFNN